PELAAYMQWLGAYQAMAFDSGGSATVVARLPGLPAPAVVNSPSDGRERPVANALLIHSTSVPGPAVKLLVNANQPLRLFAGAAAGAGGAVGGAGRRAGAGRGRAGLGARRRGREAGESRRQPRGGTAGPRVRGAGGHGARVIAVRGTNGPPGSEVHAVNAAIDV